MPNPDSSIAIVGAGIGGLTAAHALQRFGHRVAVYEQAGALDEVGAGLTLRCELAEVAEVAATFRDFHAEVRNIIAATPETFDRRRQVNEETLGLFDYDPVSVLL